MFCDAFVDPDLFDDFFERDAVVTFEGNDSHAILFLFEFIFDWN